MEISDESGTPVHEEDPFEKEIRTIFQDTLGLIHIALVAHYGLEETEATELEKDLYVWFVRFCMRPGNRSPKEFRPLLLVACCQLARQYQRYVGQLGKRMGVPRKRSRSSDGSSGGRSLSKSRERGVSSEKVDRRLSVAVATQPALFRELLSVFLNKEPGVEVVGQAGNEDEIGQLLNQKSPTVLIFDYEAL